MDGTIKYCGSCGDEIYGEDCMSLECRIKRDGPITLQELPCSDCTAKDAEIRRLREAVEWACGTLDGNCDRRYIQAELRRRAKEG